MINAKNTTTGNIEIMDLGITIEAGRTYDLSTISKSSLETSEDIVILLSNEMIKIIKNEQPEEFFSVSEAIRLIVNNKLQVDKLAVSGEGIVVNENNGHLPGNTVINWNVEKYLKPQDNYTERLIVPIGTIATINMFSGGSYNVPTFIKLEWFKWVSDLNTHIRVNPDIRMSELFTGQIDGTPISNTEIVIKNGQSQISDFEVGLWYEIETTTNIPYYTKFVDIDVPNNKLIAQTPLPLTIFPTDAKIALVDRVLAQNGNQLSTNTTSWASPPRIQGDGLSYIQINISNEDLSEPGIVTAMLNGWTESGNL
jgi:hypothetical protein